MRQVDLSFLAHPDALWWLALLIAVGVAGYAYFRLGAPLGRGQRLLLRILRGLALVLILLALLEPIWTRHSENAGRPRLSVLVDRSSSMALPTAAGEPRSEEAARLAGEIGAALSPRFDLEWLGFAGDLEPPAGEGALTWPPLGVTAMGDALEEVQVRHGDRPVGGIVMVTDGVHTQGKDPEQVARNLSVPVFTVLVGDTTPPPDVLVRQVRAQPVGYAGEPVALRVVLESHGLEDQPVVLTVRERAQEGSALRPAGPELARREVTLPAEAGREIEVSIEVTPPRVGLTLFEVRAQLAGEETVVRNNTRFVAVDVREKKTRVLYVECEPDWDFTFLKRTFDADTSLAYSYLVRQADGSFLPYGQGAPEGTGDLLRFPLSSEEFAPYAAVILGHCAPGLLPPQAPQLLSRFAEQGGGLLLLGGAGSGDLEAWRRAWGDVLPVSLRAEPRWGFTRTAAQVTVAGLAHEVTVIDETPVASEEAWRDLPPVLLPEGAYTTTAGAVTLLSGRTAHPARDVPLLAIAQTGAGRVAVVTARGFWRWDFTMEALSNAPSPAREFWRRMMRWLSEPSETERFVVRPTRTVFQDSEPIGFTARLADEAFKPVGGARVRVSLEAVAPLSAPSAATERQGGLPAAAPFTGELRRAELYPDGSVGRYAATLSALAPGRYHYRAEARLPSRPDLDAEAEGTFWVEPMGAEFFDLGASRRLPDLLAAASGGAVSDATDLSALTDAAARDYKPVRIVRQAEVWNHWGLYLALTMMLCAEWIVRRRKGLA